MEALRSAVSRWLHNAARQNINHQTAWYSTAPGHGSGWQRYTKKGTILVEQGANLEEGQPPQPGGFRIGEKPFVVYEEVQMSKCRVVDNIMGETVAEAPISLGSKVSYHTIETPTNVKLLQLKLDLSDLRAQDDFEPILKVKVVLGELIVKGSCIEKEKCHTSNRLFTCSWHNIRYQCPLPKMLDPLSLDATLHQGPVLHVSGQFYQGQGRRLPHFLFMGFRQVPLSPAEETVSEQFIEREQGSSEDL